MYSIYHTIPERVLLKTFAGKGENAGNQHFLLFLQCFPLLHRRTGLIIEAKKKKKTLSFGLVYCFVMRESEGNIVKKRLYFLVISLEILS